jgi:hypothetical protein
MKITGTNVDSKCIYCDSTNYGVGCMYSGNKYHVHTDDPKRCIYCGSTGFGVGCIYSPNKYHIHGGVYNNMIKENVQNTLITGYLMKALSLPLDQIPAFRLGLIDENLNVIKTPTTEEEKNALTILDHYIFKVRGFLGAKNDLLNNNLILERILKIQTQNKDIILNEEKIKRYEKEYALKNKIGQIIDQLNETCTKAYLDGLNNLDIEKAIIGAFKK